jgi:hypothetical protein
VERHGRPSFMMRNISECLQQMRKPTLNSKQNTLGRYFNHGAPENDMLRSDNISADVWCLEIIQ